MFETFISKKQLPYTESSQLSSGFKSKLDSSNVSKVAYLDWQEHCLECAVPDCYSSCHLYQPRLDRKCARFNYGIYINRNFQGMASYGADIRFRRWGKLESSLIFMSITLNTQELLDRIINSIYRIALLINRNFIIAKIDRTPTWILTSLKSKIELQLWKYGKLSTYHDFVLECYCTDSDSFRLIFEIDTTKKVIFRHSFLLNPGHNFEKIPVSKIIDNMAQNITDPTNIRGAKIKVYPENDLERRVIFTWLNFVSYKERNNKLTNNKSSVMLKGHKDEVSSEKVKCVAWDLDGTIWHGVLIDHPEKIPTLKDGVLETIKELDARGILQTIVSKNSYDQAWSKLEILGLSDYFLSPAINWGQKSLNLLKISKELNINIDTFAFIDDSEFERTEVQSELPQVRCYTEKQILKILNLNEFDLPITNMSRRRRNSYQDNIKRKNFEASFGESYKEFLKNCKMTIHIFIPQSKSEINRCLELIQRSNQLNLSTRRYKGEEFNFLLSSNNSINLAFNCSDKFGDYGIVGYATVEINGTKATVIDFVLSCRVAQKQVEQTFFEWLKTYVSEVGCNELYAKFKPTKKNSILYQSIIDMPLELIDDHDKTWHTYKMNYNIPILNSNIIVVQDEVKR